MVRRCASPGEGPGPSPLLSPSVHSCGFSAPWTGWRAADRLFARLGELARPLCSRLDLRPCALASVAPLPRRILPRLNLERRLLDELPAGAELGPFALPFEPAVACTSSPASPLRSGRCRPCLCRWGCVVHSVPCAASVCPLSTNVRWGCALLSALIRASGGVQVSEGVCDALPVQLTPALHGHGLVSRSCAVHAVRSSISLHRAQVVRSVHDEAAFVVCACGAVCPGPPACGVGVGGGTRHAKICAPRRQAAGEGPKDRRSSSKATCPAARRREDRGCLLCMCGGGGLLEMVGFRLCNAHAVAAPASTLCRSPCP